MNRDELHSRSPAAVPRLYSTNGVDYLAPSDPDGGGSWIAVNSFGITACLLNNYPSGVSGSPVSSDPGRFTSRGRLLISLMGHRSLSEIDSRLLQADLSEYRPFYVLAIALPDEKRSGAVLYRWDGSRTIFANPSPAPPVTTSSFETRAVVESRTDVYRRQLDTDPTPGALEAYHRSHDPDRGAYSVCVHRDDAGSKSLSHVVVRGSGITLTYSGSPPCENGPVTENRLPLRK